MTHWGKIKWTGKFVLCKFITIGELFLSATAEKDSDEEEEGLLQEINFVIIYYFCNHIAIDRNVEAQNVGLQAIHEDTLLYCTDCPWGKRRKKLELWRKWHVRRNELSGEKLFRNFRKIKSSSSAVVGLLFLPTNSYAVVAIIVLKGIAWVKWLSVGQMDGWMVGTEPGTGWMDEWWMDYPFSGIGRNVIRTICIRSPYPDLVATAQHHWTAR